ncbi:hypothetical protein B9Z55_021334 [Caenorhabditis nigoni]|uniref:Uncharacterized protein n=1 Tax=Caenorhabditis nigoni TaxID=1611254 RepID=A0A2G5TRN1_9PELO|nr:hypothetical protein B9Z55_021334 [Caenorhabditis nigoni]
MRYFIRFAYCLFISKEVISVTEFVETLMNLDGKEFKMDWRVKPFDVTLVFPLIDRFYGVMKITHATFYFIYVMVIYSFVERNKQKILGREENSLGRWSENHSFLRYMSKTGQKKMNVEGAD